MAKKSIFALLSVVLFSCVSLGETLTESLSYNETVDVTGVSSSDLFIKANMWFVDAFKSADSVIQFSDKESGTIKGKYVSDIILSDYQQFQVTTIITVEIKDSKYRISFTDPIYREYSVNGYGQRGGGFVSGDKPVTQQLMADGIKNEWLDLSKKMKESIQADTSW